MARLSRDEVMKRRESKMNEIESWWLLTPEEKVAAELAKSKTQKKIELRAIKASISKSERDLLKLNDEISLLNNKREKVKDKISILENALKERMEN